jgi:iron complex transport system ATP-binding protein
MELAKDNSFSLRQAGLQVGDKTLLQPLTLEIAAGRVTGILGHNGSGKSTLMKMLARFHAATTGSVFYAGKPLSAFSTRLYAQKVAYLQQDTPETGGMTVRELVGLGRYPWHGALGRFSRQDREKVEYALGMTSLGALSGRIVDTLSGGERQRAFLAMLVAQDAECLLLDEPISALDIHHQIEVMRLVRRLAHQHGRTILIVLHDINMAARYCDRIVALSGGRLVAHDEAAALITPPTLEGIYGVEMGVFAHPHSGLPVSYVL